MLTAAELPHLHEVTFVLGSIVLSYGLYRLLKIGSRPKDYPPGPPTVPILGNLHLIPKDKPWVQFEKWAKEYGPVYSLMLGTRTRIVLSSDEAVKDLLDKRSHIYSGRPFLYIGQEVISEGRRVFMNSNNAAWRLARKMVHTVLNINVIKTFLPYQDLESKIMLESMIDHPDQFFDHIKRYTYSLTTQMAFGFRCPSFDDERLRLLFMTFSEWSKATGSWAAQLFDSYPILRKLPSWLTPIVRHGNKLREIETENYIFHWSETKQRIKEGKNLPCFATEVMKQQSIEKFSDKFAAYTTSSIVSAGSETSADTQYAFVMAMALYPEMQKRAQEEIDRVVGTNRLPDFDDYEKLPYLRCCIKETLRWCPLVMFAIPHATTEEDFYMGYRIPKGAAVTLNTWAINMDEKRSPSPRSFNPDRHASDSTTLFQSATGDPKKRDTFSFGAGRRMCPGIHIAERTVFLGVARLLWGFNISMKTGPDGKPIKPETENFTLGVVNRPLNYDCNILPRDEKRVSIIRQAVRDDEKNLLNPETKQWMRLPEGVKFSTWTPEDKM